MTKITNPKKHLSKNLLYLFLSFVFIAILTILVLYKKTNLEASASRGRECQNACRKQYDRPNDPLYTKCLTDCFNQDDNKLIQVGCQTYFFGMFQNCAVNKCENGRTFRTNPNTKQPECMLPDPTPTIKPRYDKGEKDNKKPYVPPRIKSNIRPI